MAMAARAAMASKMAYQKEKERKMKKLFNANSFNGEHQVRGGARARAPPLVYSDVAPPPALWAARHDTHSSTLFWSRS